jgi:drug/metabolite transporter (DMT)-like permease
MSQRCLRSPQLRNFRGRLIRGPCCRGPLRGAGDGPLTERIAIFLLKGYFFVALILYAALTVLWVWILSFTPLSRAYPFLALAFALTLALGCLVFAEPFSMRLVIGIVLILCGLFFIAG